MRESNQFGLRGSHRPATASVRSCASGLLLRHHFNASRVSTTSVREFGCDFRANVWMLQMFYSFSAESLFTRHLQNLLIVATYFGQLFFLQRSYIPKSVQDKFWNKINFYISNLRCEEGYQYEFSRSSSAVELLTNTPRVLGDSVNTSAPSSNCEIPRAIEPGLETNGRNDCRVSVVDLKGATWSQHPDW